MHKREEHSKIKPLTTNTNLNIIGFITIAGLVVGIFLKWKDFSDFFFPNNVFLNWHFFVLSIVLSILLVWFVLNHLWKREYDSHEITMKERDNYKEELKISENERLTDVITGIPNSRSLEKDIAEYFLGKSEKKWQFILIDLKDFRKINNKYGFIKTNNLLRFICQSIYKKMRRNEDMYKYFNGNKKQNIEDENFYRIYPGGDEFAFIIEGDQADGLGFSNRLVDQFKALSNKSKTILNDEIKLSFHCAIVEMDFRDTFDDVFKKAEDCYQLAKEGKSDFTMCWYPINLELGLSADSFKKGIYDKSKQLFEVIIPQTIE